MNRNEFNLEKGYDGPIKYDWLVGEIDLEILKDWKPIHLESNSTILRIETDTESLPESAINTIKKLRNGADQFAKEIEYQLLKYYTSELFPEILKDLEWLKSRDIEKYEVQKNEFPYLTMKDIEKVKKYNFLSGIYIPLQKNDGVFGVTIESKWEEEHGIGLGFRDYKFVEIGQSEIAQDTKNPEKEIIQQEQLKKGIILPSPPPIYKRLKALDTIVHWEWVHKDNKYKVVEKMKGQIDENEIEIK